MSDIYEFVVAENSSNERIDKYVSEQVESLSRAAVQNLCENGNIFVNGNSVNKNYRLKINDIVKIYLPEPKELDIIEENIPLDIVYEDSDLLVVNKPKGMVVHPAAGNYSGTLVNALMFHCKQSLSGINGVMRPGIVHRIDKDTSGLLIVAKNDAAHTKLSEQIKAHTFTREYQAVVYGKFKSEHGVVDAPIGRHPTDRKKMCVTEKNSKNAITHYSVICEYDGFSHLLLRLETGRTHQIRVHMAYIGHPVAGDSVYGPKKVISSLNGQCLHAYKLGFIHPTTGEYLEFKSELPQYFLDFLKTLN